MRACELRLEWRTPIVDRTERVEFLCGASGGPEHGYVLGMARGDLFSMVANCNACSIPDALEARRSCLNLVSVRRFSGGELACRWSSRMPSQLTTVSPQMPTSLAAGSTRCMDSIYHVIPPCAGPARTGFPTRRANSSPTTGRRRKKCCGSRTGKNRPSGLQRDLLLLLSSPCPNMVAADATKDTFVKRGQRESTVQVSALHGEVKRCTRHRK